jgi:hypothetical protein
MNGATILDGNGKIISFGAIIKNKSGSEGGGRTAAAEKLSGDEIGGLAFKISTDGYIELFIDGRSKFKIK